MSAVAEALNDTASFSCTLERSALLKALAHLQGVVERRNTVPILSNVLLRATAQGELTLTATDMDLNCVEQLECLAPASGSTTLPVHILHDIVRKLPDGATIAIETDGGRATLKAGRSQFTLSCLPAEDFPVFAQETYPHTFTLATNTLIRLIDRTRFAMSTEETRYFLNGLYLHTRDQNLVVVATDGHRLAKAETPVPAGAESIPGVIVPRKTVNEVRKLLDEADEMVTVGLSANRICFRLGVVELTSKLIDGTYPDYARVIPKGNDKILLVDTAAFAAAVDRVATVSSEKTRAVKLHIRNDGVTVAASSADASQGVEEIEASFTGDKLEIGFNARYLMDVCGQISSAECQLTLADAAAPAIVVNRDDDTALYVLMPMRI